MEGETLNRYWYETNKVVLWTTSFDSYAGLGSFLSEIKRCGVKTIPQAGWFGTVREYVTEMAAAIAADHLFADHASAPV